MKQACDPYYEWLGIPPKDQPPNHYRLLGLEIFEENRDVIATAADRQMSFVKTYQCGENSELSQRVLNELSAARLCLLNRERKAAYDSELRSKLKGDSSVDVIEEAELVEEAPLPVAAPWIPAQPVLPPAIPVKPTARDTLNVPAIVIGAAGVLACVISGLIIGLAILWFRGGDEPAQTAVAESSVGPTAGQRETSAASTDADSNDPAGQSRDESPEVVASPFGGMAPFRNGGATVPAREIDAVADATLPPAELSATVNHPSAPASLPVTAASSESSEPASPEASSESATGPPELAEDEFPLRLRVPDPETQQQVRQQLAGLYDFDPQVSSLPKSELAEEFLRLASDPRENPERRFVLLRMVAESACGSRDTGLMFQAVDRIGGLFEVNTAEVKSTLLLQMLGEEDDLPTVFEFLKSYEHVAVDAAQHGDYELAYRVSSIAYGHADKPVGSSEFRQGIKDFQAEIEWLRSQSQLAEQALVALDSDEHNAQACFEAGRWLCLVRDDWDRGLDLLARGSDAELRELAARDRQGESLDVSEQMALIAAWREFAQAAEPPLRYGALVRARHWCGQVDVASLGGIDRANLTRMSEELDGEIETLRSKCRLIAGAVAEPATAEDPSLALSGDLTDLFGRGLLAALQARDFDLAERIFRRCTELDPQNVAAFNNCALATMRGRNLRGGLHLLQTACGLRPDAQAIAHNALLLSRLADAGHVTLDASTRKDLSELCSQIQASPQRSRASGFLYMPLDGVAPPTASLVDNACIYCNGLGRVKCPVRGCARGTVGSTTTEVIGRNPVNGQVLVKSRPIRVPCGTCGGRGQVDCRQCNRGIMPMY